MSFPSASPILPPRGPLSVKKRKRDESTHANTPSDIDTRPFAVRPASDDPLAKTTNFTPVCVLQRAHLPLAFLDIKGSGRRLFAAHVQVLEALHENGVERNLLVAEQKEEGRLYVVERTAKRIYVLCRLGDWITRDTLSRLSQVSKQPARSVKRRVDESTNPSPWWARAAVEMPKALSQSSIPAAASLRLAVPPIPIPSLLPDTVISENRHTGDANVKPALESHKQDTQAADAGSQDPIEELAKQYLDALYLSRTSLAYFAKGPLSRARSTFSVEGDVLTQSSDLIELLRNSVLPVSVMDKKYKDHVTALIKDLPLVTPSQDDKSVKSRRKKKFKPKRDRSGLFTNEHEYLERWWRGEELTGNMTSPENTDTALRRRIPGLRIRETYLQIIIILETLHLETVNKTLAQPTAEASNLVLESQDAETQDAESQAVPEKKRKGKKALDLHSLLETLLDRLCIWQDLDAHTPANSLSDMKSNESSNELRDFCIEIIVPFFLSRLPKEAALVNKKLGGPSPPSPEKRKSTTTSSRSRPGEPATRSRPEKHPRKPLSRVATETLNHAARPMPGLHRSATDSMLIKREDSQPAMSSIPLARPPRESALSSLLTGHRQVDLVAKSAAATERLRKKRETEAQVREAINNARKPNRPNATKESAARTDERFAQTLPQKPSRSSKSQPSIHVAATPKRPKPAFENSQHYQQFIPTSAHSSNPSIVPASSTRPHTTAPRGLGTRGEPTSTPAVPATSRRDPTIVRRASGVEETPSRDRHSNNMNVKFALSPNSPTSPSALRSAPIGFCESPTARRATESHTGGIAATPIRARGVGRRVSFGVGGTPAMGNLRDGGGVVVEATPVKGSSYGFYEKGSGDDGNGGGYSAVVAGKSIYDAWDDGDYEELG